MLYYATLITLIVSQIPPKQAKKAPKGSRGIAVLFF